MRAVASRLSHVACSLAILAMLSGTLPAVAQQQPTNYAGNKTTTPDLYPRPAGDVHASNSLPDSPGAIQPDLADQQAKHPKNPLLATETGLTTLPQGQDQPAQAQSSQPAPAQRPVGTAAAEAPNVSAVAASQPAGAAVAPAKQRRVRTIILKTGAIIGAAAAVGAVVALTAATPSKPPGAH
jgi:hypothetical protein